jgi:hypothetical protein
MTYTNTTTALKVFLASALFASGIGALTPGGTGAAAETFTQTSVTAAPARQEIIPAATTTTLATTEPASTTITAETAEQEESVARALDHFAEAGLELPAIAINIHSDRADCNGLNGYLGGTEETGWIIHSCGVDFTLLHELAHAWDRHSLDDETRAEFLELAQADTWRNTENWNLSGEEHAANVIAWGLMDERINQTRTRPFDYGSMLEGFEILTGGEPLWMDV